ncbi:uncharacterized protein LOC143260018 [Megalopta genalis]|uniref:uncharacterized protein LOC143260018 n=1 Tax=Megalopta genalis TaxID=115081 RepID=UPI003FD3A2D0
MTGRRTFMNSSDSFLRDRNNELRRTIFSNNIVNSDEPDIQKLSPNIIFSDDVTRRTLLQESNISNRSNDNHNAVNDDDDDDEFFKKIKLDIDRDLLLQSKKNHKPNSIQQNIFSLRKKRPIIDEETLNIIKRFKKDISTVHTNSIKTPTNISTSQSNSFIDTTMRKIPEKKQSYPWKLSTNISTSQSNTSMDTTMREIPNKKQRYLWEASTNINAQNCVKEQNGTRCVCNVPTSINNGGNILKQRNIFTSNVVNTHIRNPDRCGCQMSTKIIKDNTLPLFETETTVLAQNNFFFYTTYIQRLQE